MKKIFFLILTALNIYAYDPFISAQTLKGILDDKELVLIDVSDSYEKSHIIGAQSLDVDVLLKDELYTPLIDNEDMQDLFRDMGINNSSTIVIYGRSNNTDIENAAFLAYVLISKGFENVTILDGGYMAWVFEYDLFTTTKEPEIEDGFISLYDNNLSVDFSYIKENQDTFFIDARYPQLYYGISEDEDDKYIGHILGAKNSYYAYKFSRDKTLRSQNELDEFYKDGLGIDRAKNIVIYANNPKEAAVEWYIIHQHLGNKNAKIYYNSFKEYVDWDMETERFKWE
ncbi:sulfurtransferase [Sulfurimonas sp.]|uniref:sulfurtransferase n=1 Tax=Sulfurimonas sp. TaxID=2022749 RepID=UPI0035644401